MTDSSFRVSKIPTTINKRPLPAGDWELVRSCNKQDHERCSKGPCAVFINVAGAIVKRLRFSRFLHHLAKKQKKMPNTKFYIENVD